MATKQEQTAYGVYQGKATGTPLSIQEWLKKAHSMYTNKYMPHAKEKGKTPVPFETWIGIAASQGVLSADGFSADSTPTTTVTPGTVPVKSTPTKGTSIMDKLKANKGVIIGILAVGVLLGGYAYWRKHHAKK